MAKDKLELYMGPCVLESEELALEVAGTLKNELASFSDEVTLTFKGSYDKANRTSVDSYRGPDMEEGLRILDKVKNDLDLPVITDIHLPGQAFPVSKVVDVLQVPAFLCRQTDMIVAAAKASSENNCLLNIKKGQFLSPEETKNIVEKVKTELPVDSLRLTERGTSFGYNNLIVDMASFQTMSSYGPKTIHDATHCVQRPGGLGKATGGKREQIEVLAKAAVAAGADGIFLECHPAPEKALSDASTCMKLSEVKDLVEKLINIYKVV